MKSRNLVVVLLLVIVLVMASSYFFFIRNLNSNSGGNSIAPTPTTNVIVTEDEDSHMSFEHLSDARVTCEKEKDDFIPTNEVVFNIKFADDVPENYVKNSFKVESAGFSSSSKVETTVIKESPSSYKLKVENQLAEGNVYNVVEQTTNGTKKWAFQTKKTFKVENTHPNNGLYLELSEVPEIRFNGTLNTDSSTINDYFSITPPINGYWENRYNETFLFRHPDENFKENEKYTIKVKKGISDIYGNSLEQDFELTFTAIKSKETSYINDIVLYSENVFNTKEDVSFILYVSVHRNEDITEIPIKENSFRIFEIEGTKEYINVLRNINTNVNYAKELFENSHYKVVTEKKLLEQSALDIKTIDYPYDMEFQIDSNFSSNSSGYYLALIRLNDQYEIRPFQINDDLCTINFLNTGEAIALYKNKDNSNNVVDVFFNNTNVGKTNSDGTLYIIDAKKATADYDEEFNYVEFKTSTPIVFDATGSLDYRNSSWDDIYYTENGDYAYVSNYDYDTAVYSRHNNGYIYSDRPVYKVGETVCYWGFARNRVYDVKQAVISIYNDGVLVKEDKLALNELGCFKYEYKLDSVNSGTDIRAELSINGIYSASTYSNILDYTKSAYAINVEQEGRVFLIGESTEVKVTANTFDGVPLGKTSFNVGNIGNSDNYVNAKAENIVTDETGVGYGKVTFNAGNYQDQIYSNHVEVRYDNSLLDGGSKYLSYSVFPYKNDAEIYKLTFDRKTNKYTLCINEFDVKNHGIPGKDTITVKALAMHEEKYLYRTYYDEYTKKEEKVYSYRSIPDSQYDKTFELTLQNGKVELNLDNWTDGITDYRYYSFNVYINTDDGRQLLADSFGNTRYLVYDYNDDEDNEDTVNNEKPSITKKNEIPTYHVAIRNDFANYGDKIELPLVEGILRGGWEGNTIEKEKEISEDDYKGLEIYTFIVSGKGTKIQKYIGEPIRFLYEEQFGSNIEIYPIIYDGEKIYCANLIDFSYNGYDANYLEKYRFGSRIAAYQENLKLDIDISMNKEKYKPGEEAIIKVKTSHDGKGVSSGVNLSAIDSAFIDENGSSYDNILGALINPYSITARELSSHLFINFDRTDGGGGGGDGSGIRDDIVTTAYFENIITDNNGEATVKVKLPDNITEWTMTTQAISKDYRANKKVTKIIVSKDYYVSLSHKDKYLEDELFAFNVKALGKKYTGQNTSVKVAILDKDNTVIESGEIATTVGKVTSYKVKEGLKEGNYKIKVSGTLNNLEDTLVETFEVKKNMLEIFTRESLSLNPGTEIKVVSPNSRLYVLNKDVERNIGLLFSLMDIRFNGERNDSKIIGKAAWDLYQGLRRGNTSERVTTSYETDTLFMLMNNSGYDYDLALRNFAIGTIDGYYETAFDKILFNKGPEAALWARAAVGKPVLKNLKEVYKDITEGEEGKYTKEQVLYVALGLAELGDFDEANALYNSLKPAIQERDEKEYVLLTALSIKINAEDRETYYKNLLSKNALPEIRNYINLYYLQNEISRHFAEGKLVLNIDGKDENIKINNIGFTEKNVSNRSTYSVKELSDNIKVMLEDYKPLDISKYEDHGIVTKSYSTKNPKEGEVVTITITINRNKLIELGGEKGYILQDVVPNNMAFIDTISTTHAWQGGKDGQKLEYYIYASPRDNDNIEIQYHARVTNNGEQRESGIVITNYDNEVIDVLKY